ncbi:Maf family protein [Alphaproteobacteria bacterium]|nr:Maf family protein [Alphaproteobacteria bacterium]
MTLAAFTQLPAGDLVLASASSIRAKILHDVGLGYRCYPVAIDEESVRASASAEAVPVGDIAVMLAEMKAAAAVQRQALESDPSPAFVLGCDQILACDEVIYSKPQDYAMAKAQLMALSGKTHQLFSAAVLYREGERIWHHLAIAKITMRHLDEDFIDSYLDRLGAAAFTSPASYQIENLGAHLLSRIDGCHFSILGLPLLELLGILREHGLKPVTSRR